MKICFYFGVFARCGGIEEFTKDLSLALCAAGVEVSIVCASLKNPILDQMRRAGVEVVKVPVYWGCRWNIPDYALLPVAVAKLKKADVVIHQKPFKAWFYSLLPAQPQHVYLTAYNPADQFRSDAFAQHFFSFFDKIITQTESFKEDILSRNIRRPVSVLPLIPPACTPSASVTVNSGNHLRIGMMGRVERQKNPVYALNILQELSATYASVELNIYGSGSLIGEVTDAAVALGVRVEFHGKYDRGDVPEIVASNDMFLITSISEGQCIVALEILAGGRPLFSTPVGALPEILKEEKRGCLIPLDDAPAASQCIIDWLDKYKELPLAEIQQSYLNDYNPARVKQRYIDLLKTVGAAG
jgi:glycosyltransferase involved in cell wall biosynthesis